MEAGVGGRRLIALVFTGEKTASDGTPGDDAEAEGLGGGEEFAFYAAIEEIVRGLLGDEAVEVEAVAGPEGLDDLPGGEGGGANVADLAGAHEVVEGAQGLVDRDLGTRTMDLVEIDVVGLEAAETGLGLFDDVAAGVALGVGVGLVHRAVDLGGEENAGALAVAGEGLADDFLAAAAGVDVGGVDDVDAGVEGGVDDADGVLEFGAASEVHGPEGEGRNFDAGASEEAVVGGFGGHGKNMEGG